ncbi:Flp pilus assembly pilin Flp [Spinactinospora alkalitolerans]|uniref:Flp pilus assembly pilin Flp n=1 Tax=Spinactinospora alkalitolerans TaxID=687207 RepID=A0A852U4P5_9ACTN|nr:polymorphic toxin-type HINT domain-containing protein [Spinactinospora alkalitolerans]NYE50472.1 Flp pilus assembly pilin Flp [Spinactinospora alkalitolerans]
MLRRIHDPERGASFVEYTAVVLLVAGIASVLLGSGLPQMIRSGIESAVASVFAADGTGIETADGSGTPDGGGGGGSADPDGSSGSGSSSPPGGDAPGGQAPGGEDSSSQGNQEGQEGGEDSEGSPGVEPADHDAPSESPADPGPQEEEGFLDHAGDILGEGIWGGVKRDVADTVDTALNPIDTVTGAAAGTYDLIKTSAEEDGLAFAQRWHEGDRVGALGGLALDTGEFALWDSPFSLGNNTRMIADEDVVDYARDGEWDAAIARGGYNLGTMFAPGVGTLGKTGTFLKGLPETPDAPNAPRNRDGNGDPPDEDTTTRAGGDPPGTRPDNDRDGSDDGDRDSDSNDGADVPNCAANSFVPGTPVLLADGSTAPIEDIAVGEEVLAADPDTGQTGPRQVTRLIGSGGEKTLVQLTITDDSGHTDTVTATDAHPFWAPQYRAWIEAADLQPGTWLQTSAGTWVQIQATRTWTVQDQQVHNLTIADLHTYHVTAGKTDLLVHNSGGPLKPGQRCVTSSGAQKWIPDDSNLPSASTLINNGQEYTPPPGSRGRSKNKFPAQGGPANGTLYNRNPQTGNVTNYIVYDANGMAIKRVDLEGRAHGGVPTPHVVYYERNQPKPDGRIFLEGQRQVRPAKPSEIP